MAYKPFKPNKSNPDIYAKYDSRRQRESDPSYKGVKLFGFRTGLAYKMIPAVLYYAFMLFYVGSAIYGEATTLKFEPTDIVLTVLKYIFFAIMVFSPDIFLSDFKYRDSLPFFKKHQAGSSLMGLILVWMMCYFMININIYCMSDSYRASLKEYEVQRQEQMEKEAKKSDAEVETILETPIGISTESVQ